MMLAIVAIVATLGAVFSIGYDYLQRKKRSIKHACILVTKAKTKEDLNKLAREYEPVLDILSNLGQGEEVDRFRSTIEIKKLSFSKPVFEDHV